MSCFTNYKNVYMKDLLDTFEKSIYSKIDAYHRRETHLFVIDDDFDIIKLHLENQNTNYQNDFIVEFLSLCSNLYCEMSKAQKELFKNYVFEIKKLYL